MDLQKIKEFFFHLSYGEHEGDWGVFDKLNFCIYARDQYNEGVFTEPHNGPLDQALDTIQQQDPRWPNVTLHHVPQRLKARALKRRNDDVEAIRAVVADFDDETTIEELKQLVIATKPYIVVQSSPGKFHFYWVLKPGVITVKEYKSICTTVAVYLGTDENLKSPCHTLRVPWITRYLKDGEKLFTPDAIYLIDNRYHFDLKEIKQAGKTLGKIKSKYLASKLGTEGEVVDSLDPITIVNEHQDLTPEQLQAYRETYGSKESLTALTEESIFEPVVKKNKHGYEVVAHETLVQRFLKYCKEKGRNEAIREYVNYAFQAKLSDAALLYAKSEDELDAKITGLVYFYNDILLNSPGEHRKKPNIEETELTGIISSRTSFIKGLILQHIRKGVIAIETEKAILTEAYDKKHTYAFVLNTKIEDITDEMLRENMQVRYTDSFLSQEVVDAYKHKMFNLVNAFYVYHDHERRWIQQDDRHVEVRKFIKQIVANAASEELFKSRCVKLDRYGNSTGEYDPKRAAIEYDKLFSSSKQNSVLKGVLTNHMVSIKSIQELNAEEKCIATNDGKLVDLTTGNYRDVQSDDFITSNLNTPYQPEATCDEFLDWISEVYCENANPGESVIALQRALGYTLTGGNRETSVFCHVGAGSNGKSLVIALINMLAGTYGTTLSGEHLVIPAMKNQFHTRHPVERALVDLENKRVVVVDDLKGRNYMWNEEMIKAITSESIPVRHLYNETKVVPNRVKMHVALNDFPRFESDGVHMRRRFHIFKYVKEFPVDSRKEQQIKAMFVRNMPGILNWIIDGSRKWLDDGLVETTENRSFRNELFEDSNYNEDLEFFKATFEEGDLLDNYLPVKILYEHFRKRAIDRNNSSLAHMPLNEFGKRMKTYYKDYFKNMSGYANYRVKLKLDLKDETVEEII